MLYGAQVAPFPLPHNFNSGDFYWRLIIFQLIDGASRPEPSISLGCQGNLIASHLELSSMGSLIFPENGPGHQEDTSLNRLNYRHKDTAPSPILEARLATQGAISWVVSVSKSELSGRFEQGKNPPAWKVLSFQESTVLCPYDRI